jgi:predicted DNA-binding antitoxin AbrB/MazE fold protein
MTLIDAIYEDGVFKPTGPVNLPDKTPVRVQVVERPVVRTDRAPTPAMAKVYEIMSRRYDGESPDLSERHNEHQP